MGNEKVNKLNEMQLKDLQAKLKNVQKENDDLKTLANDAIQVAAVEKAKRVEAESYLKYNNRNGQNAVTEAAVTSTLLFIGAMTFLRWWID